MYLLLLTLVTWWCNSCTVDLFQAAVDKTIDEYGFQKYLATAFVLEEAIKRLGIEPKE